MALYLYNESGGTEKQAKDDSLDELVRIRENASQRLLDLPSWVAGLSTESKREDNQSLQIVPQEARDFCRAAGLRPPVHLSLAALSKSESDSDLLQQQLEDHFKKHKQARSCNASTGLGTWLLWTSVLAAGCAGGYVVLQRSGWLSVLQRYWQEP